MRGDHSGALNEIWWGYHASGDGSVEPRLWVREGGHVVTLRGRHIALTPREFAVLDVLLKAGGRIVSVDEILWQAWRERDAALSGKVRIVVGRLRRRLGDPQIIETIGGEGYRLVTTADRQA